MLQLRASRLIAVLAVATALAGCGSPPSTATSTRPASPTRSAVTTATPRYIGHPAEPTEYALPSRTLLDLKSGAVTKIPGTQPMVPGPVYGDYTVNLARLSLVTKAAFGPRVEPEWDLAAFNVRTGTTRALMRGGEWAPSVSNGWVAWEHDLAPDHSVIYASSIETPAAVPVYLGEGMQTWPQMSGHWIVWDDSISGARSYDLATGAMRVLTPVGARRWFRATGRSGPGMAAASTRAISRPATRAS